MKALRAAWRHIKFKRRNRSFGVDFLLMLFLGLFAVFSLYPMVFIFNNAFKPLNEVFLFPPRLFVQTPTLNNFRDLSLVLGDSWVPLSRYIFNTLFITVLGTAGTVLIGSLAAFPLAKYQFPGAKLMSGVIVYALMFNATAAGLVNYLTMSRLHMIDSYLAVTIPAIGSTFGVFLMRNFMTQIPDSLIEAAKIDGAGDWRIFGSIIMPITRPAWITLVILSFQSFWGESGGMYLYTEKLKPVGYAISQIVTAGVSRTGMAGAVSLIMLTVPVLLFVFSQSKVVETMTNAGIK